MSTGCWSLSSMTRSPWKKSTRVVQSSKPIEFTGSWKLAGELFRSPLRPGKHGDGRVGSIIEVKDGYDIQRAQFCQQDNNNWAGPPTLEEADNGRSFSEGRSPSLRHLLGCWDSLASTILSLRQLGSSIDELTSSLRHLHSFHWMLSRSVKLNIWGARLKGAQQAERCERVVEDALKAHMGTGLEEHFSRHRLDEGMVMEVDFATRMGVSLSMEVDCGHQMGGEAVTKDAGQGLSLPIIGPCYQLATCRQALLLKLEMASWVHHHEFVSCYDRKACLHQIIFHLGRNCNATKCMQADGDKINIDLIKYQEDKGPSTWIFTVISFLPSKKMNKDLELDLASGFGHALGWNVQQFTRKVEYVADSNELKSLRTADKPELIVVDISTGRVLVQECPNG
ncbi:hypothetical protein ARMGADRAFT_1037796 [Armillaria gallica]|uniref:Uncharacterized protein n=1 Tax=Armillaria gallica TaxID=47427 RepID=A0A2H3CP36_ARMGA|nr:hypothetical protein ARMGADRAFT_1037796 [Armillaria gallica]